MMFDLKKKNILVIGLGSSGGRYLEILKKMKFKNIFTLSKIKKNNLNSITSLDEIKTINPDLFIDLTYFNVKYFDALEGWIGNTQAGSGSTTANSPSTTKSQGSEFMSKFKLNEMLNFGFNYTYTQTYDGAEQDNPNTSMIGSQIVRVPRNLVNLITNFKVPGYNDLDVTLRTKWSDEARDYGTGNVNRNGASFGTKLTCTKLGCLVVWFVCVLCVLCVLCVCACVCVCVCVC